MSDGVMGLGGRPKDWVAIIMAIGLGIAVNVITIAVLIDALYSGAAGLSENATQILTTAFGGMIGVLGSYIGYRSARAGIEASQDDAADMVQRHSTIAEQFKANGSGKPAADTPPPPSPPAAGTSDQLDDDGPAYPGGG